MSQIPAPSPVETPNSQKGEILAQALLRLPQLVKIHQPNNKIFVENLKSFKQTLYSMWSETENISMRFHRGRLYINDARQIISPTMVMTVNKLMEFMEKRNFFGFRFTRKENLTDDDIVSFIKEVNQCQLQPEPAKWLSEQLNGNWAGPIVDENFKIAFVFTDDESGQARGRPMVWNSGVATLADKAKRSYSKALAVLAGIQERQSEAGNKASLSKSKKVVQDMVESLFEDEKLLLSLSTIRDYDDYTCTHSVNVGMLSMC